MAGSQSLRHAQLTDGQPRLLHTRPGTVQVAALRQPQRSVQVACSSLVESAAKDVDRRPATEPSAEQPTTSTSDANRGGPAAGRRQNNDSGGSRPPAQQGGRGQGQHGVESKHARGSNSQRHSSSSSVRYRTRFPKKGATKNVSPASVIKYYERLEPKVADAAAKGARSNRVQPLDLKRLATSEAFAIEQLHKFEVADALELLQVLVELEFALNAWLFPALLPELSAWLAQRIDQFDSSASTWLQVLWLYRLSPTLARRTDDALLSACIAALGSGLADVGPGDVHTLALAVAYLDLCKRAPEFGEAALRHTAVLAQQAPCADMASDVLWSIARGGYVGEDRDALVQSLLPYLESRLPELRPKQAANVLWACATLGTRCDSYCDALAARLLAAEPGFFRAKQLANLVWGWEKVGWAPGPEVLARVEADALLQDKAFTPSDWDSMLLGWVKLGHSPPRPLLQAAQAGVARMRRVVAARTVGGLIKSAGQVADAPAGYLQLLMEIVEEKLPSMTSFDLSNVMVGLGHTVAGRGPQAAAALVPPMLVCRLEERALAVLPRAKPQGLANITWGFAKLGHHSPVLMTAVTVMAHSQIQELGCRDLQDLLWSYAKLGYSPGVEALEELTARLARFVRHPDFVWSPREYATTLWSVGSLAYCSAHLVAALRRHHAVLLPRCSAMDLSNVLWGLARLDKGLPRPLLAPVQERMRQLLPTCEPAELSTILLSMARMEHYPGDELAKQAVQVALARIDDFSPKALVHMLSAYARFGLPHKGLLAAVQARLRCDAGSLDQQDWNAALGAFARVAVHPGAQVLDTLADLLEARPANDPPEPALLATALWGIAVWDAFGCRLHRAVLPLAAATPPAQYSVGALRMLWQSHVLACATGASALTEMPMELRASMAGSSDFAGLPAERSNDRLLQDVCATLGRLSVQYRCNVAAKGNLFRVDIVLDRMNEQVCIQALQRSDVSRLDRALLGPSSYRKRVLQAYGWVVLKVTYWEWEELGADCDAKENYLLALLRQHGLA